MTFLEEFGKLRRCDDIARDAFLMELRMRLAECTIEQQQQFAKLYPEPIEKMSEKTLRLAIDQCGRTIAKNRAGRQ